MNSEKQKYNSYYEKAAIESSKYETVVIFGAGSSAAYLYKKMKEQQIEIKAFLVSDKRMNRSDIDGIPIVQMDEIKVDKETALVLVGVSKVSMQEVTDILGKYEFQHYLEPDEDMAWGDLEETRRNRPAIEITTQIGCPVNCRYCPQDVLVARYFSRDKSRKKRMTLENYKQCLQNLPPDTVITFSGFCEPFLNPECADLMCYTAEHGNRMSLHTTLVGMTMKDFERIKELPFENVILHTPDRDGYANIPITDTYLQVLNSMLDAKNQDGDPLIKIANCQSEPDENILRIINHRVSFSSNKLIDRAGNIEKKEVAENVNHKGKIVCIKSPNLQRNVLLPDGSVVLCCMDFGLRHELGNLIYNSYDEIMDSEILREIKTCMETDGAMLCRRCSFAKLCDS